MLERVRFLARLAVVWAWNSRGMAFVPRFITVEGLLGGNCARLDPSLHPHSYNAADYTLDLGIYKVCTPRVNVK